ncbi:MAG: hypothetical protein PUB99_07560 [Oscillospiraceae bacterium]|nr:hypothetical protein [Oscillospiraceae bacterium]
MKQSLVHKKIKPACMYCAHGQKSCDDSCILCVKKGIMQPDSHCRRFQYDPLKRVPQKKAQLPLFSAEDFSLE